MADLQPNNSIIVSFDFNTESLPSLAERKALQARLIESLESIYQLFQISDFEIGKIDEREAGYEIELITADTDREKALQISRIIEAAVKLAIDRDT